MVSDLVEWERMVQRLGRANRRGAGEAKVVVFSVTDPDGRTAARKQPDDRSKKEAEAAHEYERMRVPRKPLTRLRRSLGLSGRERLEALEALEALAEAGGRLAALGQTSRANGTFTQ
jgi:hypothetical protein